MLIRFTRATFGFGFCSVIAVIVIACNFLSAEPAIANTADKSHSDIKPVISLLKPERAGGRGYKLVYYIDAPVEVFWEFKTDFENLFVLSNRYINAHRVVSREGNEVVTETEYSNKPGAVFRWKSTLFPEQYLLNYVLLNPGECGQEYHYGSIQLETVDSGTRVTQLAYFDFFGVSLWMRYPFAGGMSHFLKYTAHWEQRAILEYVKK